MYSLELAERIFWLVQDLLNLGAGPPAAAPAASSSGYNPLSSLSDSSFGAPPAQSSAPAFPTITAFGKDGICVSFAFSKPPGQSNVTDITATYTNSDAAPVTRFSLQVLLISSLHAMSVPVRLSAPAVGY